ncbi:MAG: ferrous iron transporter B [Clostridiales bacterium]|nr:ferrous iron transporter B [Clostridiales bacterium]
MKIFSYNKKTIHKNNTEKHKLFLLGNPNVGKSTIFNSLTGLKQHTGNWSGKTVDVCFGEYTYNGKEYEVIDLPGTHSVSACFAEECVTTSEMTESANTYMNSTTVIIADATAMKRGIILALEYLNHPRYKLNKSAILCINLYDIAQKRGIEINRDLLEKLLGIPVITISARNKKDMLRFKQTIEKSTDKFQNSMDTDTYDCECQYKLCKSMINSINETAEELYQKCVRQSYNVLNSPGHKFDKVITSKKIGIPIMILCLALILWITIKGANYPSELLSKLFAYFKPLLLQLLTNARLPEFAIGIICDGIYVTVTWIISVMLPPMAIFFPLFTILEDSGFLPRIAFNLDRCYACANMSGKQCLTQCMGLGCNAVGVTGARIMPTESQRTISILTNSFMPCNGRFALLITISAIFIGGLLPGTKSGIVSMLTVLCLIILSVIITWLVSYILSKTLYKEENVIFSLELPEYRRPEILKTLTISLVHRTLMITGRALLCSAPMGAFIWILANISAGDVSMLTAISQSLNPIGNFLGVDGFIIFAFILALPANEITLPILIMGYLSSGYMSDINDITTLKTIFENNNWTLLTAINMMLLTLYHSPCITTLMTIYNETHSIKKVLLSIILPCSIGGILCIITKMLFIFFGIA